MSKTPLLPRARTEGLVINDLTDEVLVYDLQRDQAHCLNPTAAAIWKLCDGQSTAAQIAGRLCDREAGVRSRRQGQGSSPTAREGSESREQRSAVSDQWLDVSGQPLTEQLVWLALEQLGRDHLLAERVSWPAVLPRLSRREAIRRIGIGAAIAVPLVVSISAPPPAAAGTCKSKNASCSTGAECCSKACVANKCA